ncbi:uncharacterized protein ALTATR162_LOCUS10804 [Alternaria atra]|uniref:Increased loss of mitochondrial DNA protein 1 n=1 Tax=Alternaria atra TaxID=119953 RepID=A0A8J2N7Y9_9PLEO|nr:uncharacterized protein ALTATR162_LOCUS7944 [Alternaria atra]XP_043174379.1 uncharacterized protein ALTATR162_LOCUS10804 [Alternaria atra]CAG5175055.1 unnamed protein product [Alternaria atra]CAG5183888.1 unnamed protein product [Alternaria atra]
MAMISANTLVRSIALFHLTLAVVLLKNPALISNQGVILLLGESMQLPTPRDFNKPSAATAFLAVLFAFIGLTDLTALSLHEDVFDQFWGLQAPVRLLFLFGLTAYSYMFKEGGMFAPRGMEYRMSAGASLNNSFIFTWGFIEVFAWFWVFTTLREERSAKATKMAEKQAREADQNTL